ncbi:hypothetical protein [Streptomyces sp. TE5632]
MPLAGPGLLVGSLAPDSATLRRRLDAALDDLLTGVLAGEDGVEGLSRAPRPVSAPARG